MELTGPICRENLSENSGQTEPKVADGDQITWFILLDPAIPEALSEVYLR